MPESGLARRLKGKKIKRRSRKKVSLWKGPETDGITQSMLSRFLCCRERFRLQVVEGLRPADTFNHRLEYGEMWHLCESAGDNWRDKLTQRCKELCGRYPLQQEQISQWHQVCETQFPIYLDYWFNHEGNERRTPVHREEVFSIPYKLPSGRSVILRGKWDGTDLVGKGKEAPLYLLEHKTKGDIVEAQLKTQLDFDLQTMFYLVALSEHWTDRLSHKKTGADHKIRGVLYNVVRRPLSGGRHSIRQHKESKSKPTGESLKDFYSRLGSLIEEDAGYFFMRWKVDVSKQDVINFRNQFLDPVLESLCDWWEYIKQDPFRPWNGVGSALHWRHPYGVWNVLNEGGSSELDEYMATGSELGLQRVDKLFTELG